MFTEVIEESEYQLVVKNGGTLYNNQPTEQACYWVIENPLRTQYYIDGKSELTIQI